MLQKVKQMLFSLEIKLLRCSNETKNFIGELMKTKSESDK